MQWRQENTPPKAIIPSKVLERERIERLTAAFTGQITYGPSPNIRPYLESRRRSVWELCDIPEDSKAPRRSEMGLRPDLISSAKAMKIFGLDPDRQDHRELFRLDPYNEYPKPYKITRKHERVWRYYLEEDCLRLKK